MEGDKNPRNPPARFVAGTLEADSEPLRRIHGRLLQQKRGAARIEQSLASKSRGEQGDTWRSAYWLSSDLYGFLADAEERTLAAAQSAKLALRTARKLWREIAKAQRQERGEDFRRRQKAIRSARAA